MLPSHERLTANALFKQVFVSSRSFAEPQLVLRVLALPDSPTVRETGFSVSKKVGNAVVRNRTKRRLRALVAALGPELPRGFRAVIVARGRIVETSTTELAAALRRAYVRAGLLRARPSVDGV